MTTPDDQNPACRDAYQGDAVLSNLLAKHGVDMAVTEVAAGSED